MSSKKSESDRSHDVFQENINSKSCKGADKLLKTVQTAWFWKFLDISWPDYLSFNFCFLGWHCLICAVILNTIQLCFMTTIIGSSHCPGDVCSHCALDVHFLFITINLNYFESFQSGRHYIFGVSANFLVLDARFPVSHFLKIFIQF